jgi:hypothetical protein
VIEVVENDLLRAVIEDDELEMDMEWVRNENFEDLYQVSVDENNKWLVRIIDAAIIVILILLGFLFWKFV